jgi:lipopolysaccharide export system protein LptC
MKERFSTLFSIGIMVVLVIGTWWAAEYAQNAVIIDPPPRITHERDNWSQNFVVLRTDEQGHVIHRLEGDNMDHFPDDLSYEVTTPRGFGLRADNPLTVATAKMATIYDEGNRIVMEGNAVLLRLADATRQALNFTSEKITMLVKEDLTFTDLPAIAVSGRSRMDGIGMRYNNNTQQLDVFKATEVDIAPKDKRDRSKTAEPRTQP